MIRGGIIRGGIIRGGIIRGGIIRGGIIRGGIIRGGIIRGGIIWGGIIRGGIIGVVSLGVVSLGVVSSKSKTCTVFSKGPNHHPPNTFCWTSDNAHITNQITFILVKKYNHDIPCIEHKTEYSNVVMLRGNKSNGFGPTHI